MTRVRYPRSVPALLLFLFFGCVSSSLERTAENRRVVLHTVFSTGGDAPGAQSLIFFADGSVRLRSAGDKPRWSRLSKADSKELLELIAAPELKAAVNALPHVYACCDARELSVSLGKSADDQLDAVRNPPTVRLRELRQMPLPIRKLLAARDALGQRYFGRRYWIVQPFPERLS